MTRIWTMIWRMRINTCPDSGWYSSPPYIVGSRAATGRRGRRRHRCWPPPPWQHHCCQYFEWRPSHPDTIPADHVHTGWSHHPHPRVRRRRVLVSSFVVVETTTKTVGVGVDDVAAVYSDPLRSGSWYYRPLLPLPLLLLRYHQCYHHCCYRSTMIDCPSNHSGVQ